MQGRWVAGVDKEACGGCSWSCCVTARAVGRGARACTAAAPPPSRWPGKPRAGAAAACALQARSSASTLRDPACRRPPAPAAAPRPPVGRHPHPDAPAGEGRRAACDRRRVTLPPAALALHGLQGVRGAAASPPRGTTRGRWATAGAVPRDDAPTCDGSARPAAVQRPARLCDCAIVSAVMFTAWQCIAGCHCACEVRSSEERLQLIQLHGGRHGSGCGTSSCTCRPLDICCGRVAPECLHCCAEPLAGSEVAREVVRLIWVADLATVRTLPSCP